MFFYTLKDLQTSTILALLPYYLLLQYVQQITTQYYYSHSKSHNHLIR
jgi:hypothetical protein